MFGVALDWEGNKETEGEGEIQNEGRVIFRKMGRAQGWVRECVGWVRKCVGWVRE